MKLERWPTMCGVATTSALKRVLVDGTLIEEAIEVAFGTHNDYINTTLSESNSAISFSEATTKSVL